MINKFHKFLTIYMALEQRIKNFKKQKQLLKYLLASRINYTSLLRISIIENLAVLNRVDEMLPNSSYLLQKKWLVSPSHSEISVNVFSEIQGTDFK